MNKNLNQAKTSKNDEFYTQLVDIEKELAAYDPAQFAGMRILCPCDDYRYSNFTKFFVDNFDRLQLESVVSTHIATDNSPAMKHTVTSNGVTIEQLQGDGDFRSAEISALRDESDIVVTNPPFSLFREFINWLDGKFLILGNMNAITYKNVFPLIQNNKVWLGSTNGGKTYKTPNGEQKLGNTCWFTNMKHRRRNSPLQLKTMQENKELHANKARLYERYNNYNAIEVPRTQYIPSDYDGVMGVPISFLDKYNPEQFEIVGCSYDYGAPVWLQIPYPKHCTPYINNVRIYKRLFIQHRIHKEK